MLAKPAERGAVAAEFALVASLLLMLLFAMVELGLMVNAQLVVAQASREGARRAAIEGGNTPVAQRVIYDELKTGGLNPALAQASISPQHAIYGTPVSVAVRYRYLLVTPLARLLGRSYVNLEARFTSRSEYLISPGGP